MTPGPIRTNRSVNLPGPVDQVSWRTTDWLAQHQATPYERANMNSKQIGLDSNRSTMCSNDPPSLPYPAVPGTIAYAFLQSCADEDHEEHVVGQLKEFYSPLVSVGADGESEDTAVNQKDGYVISYTLDGIIRAQKGRGPLCFLMMVPGNDVVLSVHSFGMSRYSAGSLIDDCMGRATGFVGEVGVTGHKSYVFQEGHVKSLDDFGPMAPKEYTLFCQQDLEEMFTSQTVSAKKLETNSVWLSGIAFVPSKWAPYFLSGLKPFSALVMAKRLTGQLSKEGAAAAEPLLLWLRAACTRAEVKPGLDGERQHCRRSAVAINMEQYGCHIVPIDSTPSLLAWSTGRITSIKSNYNLPDIDAGLENFECYSTWPELFKLMCGNEASWERFLSRAATHRDEIFWRDPDGSTILHPLLQDDGAPLKVLRAILREFPQAASIPDSEGCFALHAAVANAPSNTISAPFEIIKLLIETYDLAAVQQDCRGIVPLNLAISGRAETNIIKLLLESHPEAMFIETGKLTARDEIPDSALNKCAWGWAWCSENGDLQGQEAYFWEQLGHLLQAGWAYRCVRNQYCPLHAAIALVHLDRVIRNMCKKYPAQYFRERDADGNTPLTLACSLPSVPSSTIEVILDHDSDSAKVPNERGKLPLHVAIDNGRSWDQGTLKLFECAPRGLGVRNVNTRLYPFMTAAVDGKCDLDTVYSLLRRGPHLVTQGLSQLGRAEYDERRGQKRKQLEVP